MTRLEQSEASSAKPGSQTARVYGVTLSLGVLCGLAIATTYELTRPIIQGNKIALRQDAILDVLPAVTTSVAFRFDPTQGRFVPDSADSEAAERVFAGFDDDGKLRGVAIETRGMGYQDFIRLLYGYSFKEQAIIGIRVLESRETPGLGDRIETDADFLANFECLELPLESSAQQLAHPIKFVKAGNKTRPWEIDGITGATISSLAVAEMLRDSTQQWIPVLYRHRSDFKPPQQLE